MLDLLLGPVGIALLAVVLAMLISLLVVQTRRRAKDTEIIPPPDVGESVDYTSMEYEEPTTWSDRFRQASPAAKALLVLLPLVLLASIGIIYFAFLYQPGADATAETTEEVAPPPEISEPSALVAGENRILIQADTTLPGGTTVTAAMRENNEDFTWFDPANATDQVRNDAIRMSLTRQDGASTPDEDAEYTVVLSAQLDDGEVVNFDPIELEIPPPNRASFFEQASVATAPEPTEEPAPEPTEEPTPEPTEEPTPEPTEEPQEFTAVVFNGGNLRAAPNLGGQVLDQINANESVTLREQTADGTWYRIINERGVEGWVSVTLLSIDADVAGQVPIEGQAAEEQPEESTDEESAETPASEPTGLTATVFNGGNVRSAPNLSGAVQDQINANETVQLLERTADGTWYRISNEREVEGWVSVTLLTIDAAVAEQVPIAQ